MRVYIVVNCCGIQETEVTVLKVHEPHDSSAGAGGLSYVCWMQKFILRLGLALGAGVAGSVH